MAVTPANGVNYQYRQDDYGVSDNLPGPATAAPTWVKLVRCGTDFSGYASTNGTDWELVAVRSNNMPAKVQVGLAVTAHDRGALNTATFDLVSVSVGNANHPPVLSPIADQTIHAGTLISIPASASDPDLPSDVLTFSLTGSGGLGASVNPTNGNFAWQPGAAYVNTTNGFSLSVADAGSPALSATQSFTITVRPPLQIETIDVTGPVVTVNWSAIPGTAYYLQWNDSLLANSWSNLPGQVIALGPIATKQDSLPGNAQRFYRVLLAP